MTVRKLKNGSWIATVDFGYKWNGERDRRSKTCKTKREALAAERAMNLELDGGKTERITFEEFLELVYWPQKQNIRANTRRGYERDIKLRLIPWFGNLNIGDINRFAIQQMISACETKKIATNARETLSSILSVAVDMEMLTRNPARLTFQYPAASDLPKDNYGEWLSTFAEHRRLLEHLAQTRDGEAVERMVVLGLCFGLRKGEILGLDWAHINLNARELHVVQTYTVAGSELCLTPPKTPRSIRSIPINRYAAQRLACWSRDGQSVVGDAHGKRLHPHTAAGSFRRLTKDAYLDGTPLPRITLHSLRHSFATSCINAGIEVSKVSAWLGHCDVSTTYNRYVKPTLTDLKCDAEMIDLAYNEVALAIDGNYL